MEGDPRRLWPAFSPATHHAAGLHVPGRTRGRRRRGVGLYQRRPHRAVRSRRARRPQARAGRGLDRRAHAAGRCHPGRPDAGGQPARGRKRLGRTSGALARATDRQAALVAVFLLEIERARFGHLQQATAGVDARDGAFAQRVKQAIGVAVLDPQPLRDAQLLALLYLAGLQPQLVGNGHALVPLCRLHLEAIDDLGRTLAVAGLVGLALVAGESKRGRPDEGSRADDGDAQHPRQFLLRSTSARCLIQGIISRSLAPTCSIGCSASLARVALNEVWLTLFSSIQSLVKRPDWMSVKTFFISAFTSGVMTRGPETYSP